MLQKDGDTDDTNRDGPIHPGTRFLAEDEELKSANLTIDLDVDTYKLLCEEFQHRQEEEMGDDFPTFVSNVCRLNQRVTVGGELAVEGSEDPPTDVDELGDGRSDEPDTELGKIIEAYRYLIAVDVGRLDKNTTNRLLTIYEQVDPIIENAVLDGRLQPVPEVGE